MNFLETGLSLKIVPESIKNIKSGTILNVDENLFTVELKGTLDSLLIYSEVEVLVNINSGVLKFNTTIQKIENNILSLIIPEKYSTVQRREYPRIKINIPVTIEQNEGTNKETSTDDISGGGMKIFSDKEIERGIEFVAKLKITNGKNIKTIFKVLRTTKESQDNKDFILSGKFADISHSDRTTIIQLCFRKQLEQKFKRMRSH